jgi:hypothetical protein
MKLSVHVLGREVAVLESAGDFKSVLTYLPNTAADDFVSLTMPKLNAGSPYWITLNETDEQRLRDWVRNSSKIHTASLAHTEEGAL